MKDISKEYAIGIDVDGKEHKYFLEGYDNSLYVSFNISIAYCT